jgi:hypothetical protein
MARAKANPDPMLVKHSRSDMPGVVFEIEAFRDGGYNVRMDGKFLFSRAGQLGAFGGASRYPSNRMQADAIESAKSRINGQLRESFGR